MNQYTNDTITREDREKEFIKRLDEKYPTLEYIGGYVNSEKPVVLKCKICGYEFTRSAQCIRGTRKTTCFKCKSNNKIINKMIRKQELYLITQENKRNKEIEIIYSYLKNNTIYIRKCVECNDEYIGQSKSKYCPHCRKIIRKKHSSKSLRKLYERDKGICQLCHTKCNWNDKEIINGTTIVGNTYPSIDHIIPIAKGGNDDWNNIQLAHFKCNWVKGACLEN